VVVLASGVLAHHLDDGEPRLGFRRCAHFDTLARLTGDRVASLLAVLASGSGRSCFVLDEFFSHALTAALVAVGFNLLLRVRRLA